MTYKAEESCFLHLCL